LRAADRGLHIVAVEQRAAVIDVARSHFQLPDDRRFEALCSGAEDFLRHDSRLHDLILADLFVADGMYQGQVAADFLRLCRQRLSETGILVVNQWASEFQSNRVAFEDLRQVFDDRVLTLHVQGGNIISFGLRAQLPDLRRDALFAAAQALGLRLGIPLQRHARNLWRQNAETLGVGRFRRPAAR
jgi:spermidine synthase